MITFLRWLYWSSLVALLAGIAWDGFWPPHPLQWQYDVMYALGGLAIASTVLRIIVERRKAGVA